MRLYFKLIIWIVLPGLLSCEEEDKVFSYLDSVNSGKYYSQEIFPGNYQNIYGQWKLVGVSGGFSGTGYEPDFDYLEIKKIGIYGLIENDSVFEYGKIELDTFDNSLVNGGDVLQVRFNPTLYNRSNPYMSPPEKYIDILGDSLALLSPCCDMFNYHFIRKR